MKVDASVILEATLRVIRAGGVHAVRYREVAAESGVALGTISYQFPSREGLVRAAFTHFLDESTRTLRTFAETRTPKAPQELAPFLAALLEADFQDERRLYLAEYELLVYAARDPEIANALAAWDRATVAEFGQLVEGAGVPSPFATARLLMDVIRGFQLASLGSPAPDFAGFQERVTRVVLALCATEQAEGASATGSPKRNAASRRKP